MWPVVARFANGVAWRLSVLLDFGAFIVGYTVADFG
jgi:hypothetical protein